MKSPCFLVLNTVVSIYSNSPLETFKEVKHLSHVLTDAISGDKDMYYQCRQLHAAELCATLQD